MLCCTLRTSEVFPILLGEMMMEFSPDSNIAFNRAVSFTLSVNSTGSDDGWYTLVWQPLRTALLGTAHSGLSTGCHSKCRKSLRIKRLHVPTLTVQPWLDGSLTLRFQKFP